MNTLASIRAGGETKVSQYFGLSKVARACALLGAVFCTTRAGFAQAVPILVPPENPITEEKRVLGKMLFWDEQLSTSRTVSCGTCHNPSKGFAEQRQGRGPGRDGQMNTSDDTFGSPGVISSTNEDDYKRDRAFIYAPQVTPRTANALSNVANVPELFWDGRAQGTFIDPQTGAVVIPFGGQLESLVANPPLSSIEMAHEDIDWNQIVEKLSGLKAMDLATELPPDLVDTVAARPTYREQMANAFGDSEVTASRVCMAVATYLRTLVSDRNPMKDFENGNQDAMTAAQQQGRALFISHGCSSCHRGDGFTDNSFRNIGLRHSNEDPGRMGFTNDFEHRGQFKMPTLFNVGLKRTFMHTGQFTNLADVIRFYMRDESAPPQVQENIDRSMGGISRFNEEELAMTVDFLQNALTDPRMRDAEFPFDKPLLYTENIERQNIIIDTGTRDRPAPIMIADAPAMLCNLDFRLGLGNALPGVFATLNLGHEPPTDGIVIREATLGPVLTQDFQGNEIGTATIHWPLAPGQAQDGEVLFAQWEYPDRSQPNGTALSQIVQITFFRGLSGGCNPTNPGCDSIDFNNDGVSPDQLDLDDFLSVFGGGPCSNDPLCGDIDFNNDGVSPDQIDIEMLLTVFGGGNC